MMLAALGFMIGTGGSAVVSKALGEGRNKEANEYFSLLVYAALIRRNYYQHIRIHIFKAACNHSRR